MLLADNIQFEVTGFWAGCLFFLVLLGFGTALVTIAEFIRWLLRKK